MSDGYVNKCKECCKEETKKTYQDNKQKEDFRDKQRKRGREKYHRLYVGKVKTSIDTVKEYNKKYPEKYKAKYISQYLKKPFEGAERHHWSYNLEHAKNVIWLNTKDHNKVHRFIIYDQERFMYRRFDNNILLDTIESHEKFIRECLISKED